MTTPTTPDVALPEAMIEAAAEAWTEHDRLTSGDSHDDRQDYHEAARVALTAALGVCEVREQWGAHLWRDGDEDAGFDTWLDNRAWALARVASHARRRAESPSWLGNARLIRRLSITTPPEPVDTEPDPSTGQP